MAPSTAMDCFSANNKKRKNDEQVELDTSLPTNNNNNRPIIAPITTKRHHHPSAHSQQQQQQTPVFTESYFMPNQSHHNVPPRSTTPPLSMTLAHSNANGSYATSVVKSANEHSTNVCSGMTPVYRPAAERWGSSFL